MDGHPFIAAAVQLVGAALVLLAIGDVFMTVLYARVGTGPLSHRIGACTWAMFRRVGRCFAPPRRGLVLSYSGPILLAFLLAVWLGLLLLGFTLIAWGGLGKGVTLQAGGTPTDFLTAFYYAGGSMTTVGSGDLRPVSAFFKFLTVIDSVIGMLVLTLAVTYIVQIYSALHARNSLAMTVHHASGGSGDAALLLYALGPGDDFTRGQGVLDQLSAEVTTVYESHHFYSVLIYFRFPEPHYAMARGTLVSLELVTLMETALDEAKHGWLPRVACVTQLREATMHILTEFAGAYLPGKPPPPGSQPAEVTTQWRRRYRAAVALLKERGISTVRDERRGEDRYVELRKQWDAKVFAFARYMEHPSEEIDPTGARPAETGGHREMPVPELRAAG